MAAPRKPENDGRLDWGGSWGGGKQQPCRHCGELAFLRHPVTGAWMHKVCAETAAESAIAAAQASYSREDRA